MSLLQNLEPIFTKQITESVLTGTTYTYTYPLTQPITTSGGASRSTTDEGKAKADVQAMFNWKVDYLTVLWQNYPLNQTTFGTLDNMLSTYHVASFTQFWSAIVKITSTPIFTTETRTITLTDPEYKIYLPQVGSTAEPVQTLFVTQVGLEQILKNDIDALAQIVIAYQIDPSTGRARTIEQLTYRIQVERDLLAGIVHPPSAIATQIIATSGTPVTQVTSTPEGDITVSADQIIPTSLIVKNVNDAVGVSNDTAIRGLGGSVNEVGLKAFEPAGIPEGTLAAPGLPTAFYQLKQQILSNPFLLLIAAVGGYGLYEYLRRRHK